jgi:hypothetical protein
MCDIPFDRSILQLSNGIKHVMPSTDRMLELTAKSSMAQPSHSRLCVPVGFNDEENNLQNALINSSINLLMSE